MRVKVCGITCVEDAVMCEDLGANAVGFVRVDGRARDVPMTKISDICSTLGPMTTTVLVCSPKSREDAADMFLRAGTDVLQLHSLGPRDVQSLKDDGIPLIRAVKPSRADASRFSSCADALLFEAGSPGTGTTYDYSQVPVDICARPIIAGGLTIHNVNKAVAAKPYAVDVSSGVERAIGRKDPALVSEFIRRCRR